MLELKSGRSNHKVLMRDGSSRHPYMLMEIFQAINYHTQGAILQYQIEQNGVKEFIVRLVLEEEEMEEGITEEIQRGFVDRLGYEVQIGFAYYKGVLPRMDAGKPAVFLTKAAPEGRPQ